MPVKSGKETTEFWLTALSTLAAAVFGAFVVFRVFTQEEADALLAVAVAALPLLITIAPIFYTLMRSWLKARTAQAAAPKE